MALRRHATVTAGGRGGLALRDARVRAGSLRQHRRRAALRRWRSSGLPSLHSIIEAIANGFFSALAGALVPGFLKHGTVATIQHLVALPDPATWGHVGELESDMTYLGMSLMPVTLGGLHAALLD